MTLVTRRRSDQTQQTTNHASVFGKENEADFYVQDSQAPWDDGITEEKVSYGQRRCESIRLSGLLPAQTGHAHRFLERTGVCS